MFVCALALSFITTTPPQEKMKLPDLPKRITSFGAAVVGDHVYVCGGHTGAPHSYSQQDQNDRLWRINLREADEWEEVGEAPRRQGMAMIAYGQKIYRLGGFEALNAKGEEDQLQSTTDFACFDPEKGEWESLPSLPEPRSSFDAVVVGSHAYVMGGWALIPGKDPHWHQTAFRCDLSQPKPEWLALSPPPFKRRALALAYGKLGVYAIGGMEEKGGITRRVAVYNSDDDSWSEGPELPGESMDGFGASAFTVADQLYVTTSGGQWLRLTDDGKKWESLPISEPGRFFHRMVGYDNKLLVVGGTTMGRGPRLENVLIDPNGMDGSQGK